MSFRKRSKANATAIEAALHVFVLWCDTAVYLLDTLVNVAAGCGVR